MIQSGIRLRGLREAMLVGSGKTLKRVPLLLTAAVLALAGCSSKDSFGPQNQAGNLILYVSNQSFDITPIDITVYIDGQKALKDDFEVGSQHTWVPYGFSLAAGKHTIKAVSKKGDAILEKEFEVKGKHWATLAYWYYPKLRGGAGPTPKSFSFSIEDKPIGFM